jgi:hypothetical protein
LNNFLNQLNKVLGEPISIAVGSVILAIVTVNNVAQYLGILMTDLTALGTLTFILFIAYAVVWSMLFKAKK